MTVPHISIPSRLAPGPRIAAVRAGWRAPAGPRTRARRMRVAWLDVLIQMVGIAVIAYGVWWVVTAGIFAQGVGLFTGWYTEVVAPELSVDLSIPGGAAMGSVFLEGDPGEVLRPPR